MIWEGIYRYFAEDWLRVLYAIGGSGGVWFWIQTYRGRTRVDVSVIRQTMDNLAGHKLVVELRFQIENLGDSPTSIRPSVKLVGYRHGQRCTERIEIEGTNRRLESHTPVELVAKGRVGVDYPFWTLKSYKFQLSKGRNRTLRLSSQAGGQISFWRYCLAVVRHRLAGSPQQY